MGSIANMIELSFPWPPKELSPNARVHWATKAKAAKKYKSDCYWLCRFKQLDHGAYICRPRPNLKKMPRLTVSFHPPSKRRADIDNMFSSYKYGLDAIAEFLGIDDSQFTYTLSKADPVKHGSVRVVIR